MNPSLETRSINQTLQSEMQTGGTNLLRRLKKAKRDDQSEGQEGKLLQLEAKSGNGRISQQQQMGTIMGRKKGEKYGFWIGKLQEDTRGL